MGSLFIFLIATPIISLFLYILSISLKLLKPRSCCLLKIHSKVNKFLNFMFFNGIIKFYQNNCFVLVVISLIQITDIRISSQFSIAERFCSIFAIIVLIISFLLPVAVSIVYIVNIGKSTPLPDLNDYMSVEELKYIYGTIDIKKI